MHFYFLLLPCLLLLFSYSVVSYSLWPHGLQHTRLPSPSPPPRICSNSCQLSQWCHPNISSSLVPFSPCLQSFPVSGSFPVSQFFNQVAKILEFQPRHQSFQWIFRTDFLYHSSKASIPWCSAFFKLQLLHSYMTTSKTIALSAK